MKLGRKKLAGVAIVAALLMTTGVTALAAESTQETQSNQVIQGATSDSTAKADTFGKSSIWNILTDDQKAQLANDAKAKLKQDLADKKITQEQYDKMITAIDNGEIPRLGRGERGDRQMTEEQKAAKDAMKAKWDALTEAQRNEIYGLYDQQSDIQSKMIDKYLEYGLIDTDTASSMKEGMKTERSDMVDNSRMPMLGRGGRGGRMGGFGGMKDKPSN